MIRPFRLTALLVLAAACADSTAPARSTGPYTSPPPPVPVATVPTAPTPDFPTPPRPGVIYAEVGAPYGYAGSTQYHGGLLASTPVAQGGLQSSSRARRAQDPGQSCSASS